MTNLRKDTYRHLIFDRTLYQRLAVVNMILAALAGTSGCNGLPGSKDVASQPPKDTPQIYMAPIVGNSSGVTANLESYSFDFVANPSTFVQSTSQLQVGSQSQINTSGDVKALARNLLELDTTYTFPVGRVPGSGITATTYDPAMPLTGSWAVLLPDKTGGFVQLLNPPTKGSVAINQPVTPLVEAVCPASATAATYQFLTIPNALLLPNAQSSQLTATQMWDPTVEAAYGSVDISGTASNVNLSNTQQFLFPFPSGEGLAPGVAPGATVPTAFAASTTGICSPTLYGNTTSVPGQVMITSPGNGQMVSASATIGVSSSGLLVEDNGTALAGANLYANMLGYQNALGAGTGAIGLLKPKSAVDTGSLVGAQYNGFIFGAGDSARSTNSTSEVASFGFPATPTAATCVDVPVPTSASNTLIDGGDFPNSTNAKNDPSDPAVQSAGGYGNCNYAIDLGAQDAANNGFYPAATLYVGATFSGNSSGTPHSFPAIAIAGSLAGKNAIFVLGVDMIGSPNQAVGIYLLQSN